jgi:hypothetical protein
MGRPREHFVPLIPQGQVTQYLAIHQRKIALLQERLKQVGNDKLKDVRAEMTLLQRSGLPSGVPGAYAVQEGKPVDQYVHIRGDVNHHGPVVPRGVPTFLSDHQPLHIPPGSAAGCSSPSGLRAPIIR